MSAPDRAELIRLFGERRFAELELAAQEVLQRDPAHGFAWQALATALRMLGKPALEAARQAVALLPADAEALMTLGVIERENGRLTDAIATYRKALTLLPETAPAKAQLHANLANALGDAGEPQQAVAHGREAILLAPGFVNAHNILGHFLNILGHAEEAAAVCRHAIALDANNLDARNNLGNALRSLGRLGEAEQCYRHVLARQPQFIKALVNLAAILTDQGRATEAVPCCRQAIALQPQLAEAHNNLADALRELWQHGEALQEYGTALSLKPGHAQTCYNASLLLLALGRYGEAWPLHERRTDPARGAAVRLPPLASPPWRGEPLAGCHLVLCHEQGLGDAIQFLRYAALARAAGAHQVSIVCPPPLVRLFAGAEGVDVVYSSYEMVPPHDWHLLIMSAPLGFGTTVDKIPPAPRIVLDPALLAAWRERLPGIGKDAGKKPGKSAGLIWRGNPDHKKDRHRSLPGLATLAPLLQQAGWHFISLQKGAGEEEALQAETRSELLALGHLAGDMADTAAIVAQLDLVITVDTAVAHLAGTLGTPCWVLLPHTGVDWRWGFEGDATPWYPGMRLFRQAADGGWADVVEQVRQALQLLPGMD